MSLNKNLTHFYKLFKIPKIKLDYPDNFDEFYPEITDAMYIKLILLNLKSRRHTYCLLTKSLKALKAEILEDCCALLTEGITYVDENKIIKKVQQILKEG